MNSISRENIKSLKAEHLTQLLLMLLHLEHKKYNFPSCYISVPQNITTPDGGEDGRITTVDYKDSRWIVDVFCLFQSKATSMTKAQCKNEILNTKNDALKDQVKDLFDKNGTYILFTTDDYVEQNLQDRVDGFRDAVKLVENEEYCNKVKIKIYDANLIRDWTNEFISAVSYVQLCCGKERPLGLQIWSELKSHPSNSSNFKTNSEIDNLIKKIRIDGFSKKNIRIEGVSGIGKTRLICETFSPGIADEGGNFDIIRKSLSDSIIYFDILKGNIQNIFDFIRSTVTTFPAILVLDNCDPVNHENFLDEVLRTGSLQTLITIDYEKSNRVKNDFYNIIELDGKIFNSVVEEILKDEYSNSSLSDRDIEYLIKFSEGNPKMAINFVTAAINKSDLNQGFDKELLVKLIFGREIINEIDFNILKLCSVFRYFEYPSEEFFSIDKAGYKLLLEHIQFFSNFLEIDTNTVEKIIKKYLEKGVLERRGNKLVIRPNPLSLKLSILFWDELNIVNYESFIDSIPKNLATSLADQLSQLGSVGKAKELVETIWGIDGNFSTAEILNSNMGSRLFRSIVTVNPKATLKVLTKNYLDKSKEYLISIVESRQNLVWALEKLCFREETFVEAGKVLMCFAVAEIQTYYSNNATSYFTQLFRIYLAGTEVGYSPRIEVLKWALSKQDPDFDTLVLKSCGSAFTPTYNLNKIGGAEQQGGLLPLEDYNPETAKEINDYREQIIELLLKFVSHENLLQFSTQRIIYRNISNLFEFNFEIDKLKIIIDKILLNVVDSDDLLKSLYTQVSFKRLHQIESEFIANYIDKLKTNSIEERILYNVSEPKIIIGTIKDEEAYGDKGKRLAEEFAKDIVAENIDIRPYFKKLLVGKQFNSFDFGKKLAELKEYDQAFVDNLVSEVLILEKEQYNLSFLSGYISTLESDKKNDIFNFFIINKSSIAFNIFRLMEISFERILKLVDLVQHQSVLSNYLQIIKYDVIKLNSEDLIKYFELIKNLENGRVLIIDTFHILEWNAGNDNFEVGDNLLIYIKSIVEEENLLININKVAIIDSYSWQEIITLLIKKFQHQICSTIAIQIVQYNESLSLFAIGDSHIADVANLTLDVDFENCWNIYSRLFSDKKTILFWEIFDTSFSSGVTFNHPFFRNDDRNTKLLSWLLKNKEVAPWIIRIAPLFDENGDDWFPFTESLINVFGTDKHFKDELSCNLHSMSSWGSRVPYFAARLRLVEKLKDHKIEEVKEWAISEIEGFERKIKIEEISDDEGFLRL